MIKIKLINQEVNFGDETRTVSEPERQLTDEEKQTITSILFNGNEVIYYQNDEQ